MDYYMRKAKEDELQKLDKVLSLIDGIPNGAEHVLANTSRLLFNIAGDAQDMGHNDVARAIYQSMEYVDDTIEDLQEFVENERYKADYWGDKASQ